jgi:creatinine amidohydrolase
MDTSPGSDGEILWQQLRRDRIAELAAHDPVLLQPIGAIEQHGPHLPIDTDINSVTTVATRAAEALGPESALMLPPIPWGLSPYWLPFAGTLSLQPETILAVIGDIGRSVAAHGFRRMVIVNGHGGNAGIIGVAATQLAEHGIRAVALSYWALIHGDMGQITPRDYGAIGHAGQTETSIQLYLQPHRVHPGYRELTGWTDLRERAEDLLTAGAYKPPLPLVEAPSGVYGDPTAADARLGQQVVERAVDGLVALIRGFPQSQASTST